MSINFAIFKSNEMFCNASDEDIIQVKKWVSNELISKGSIDLDYNDLLIGIHDNDRCSNDPELYVITILKKPSNKQMYKIYILKDKIIRIDEIMNSSDFVKQNAHLDELKNTPFDLDETYSLITDPIILPASPVEHSNFDWTEEEIQKARQAYNERKQEQNILHDEAQLKLLNRKTGESWNLDVILYDSVKDNRCGYYMNPKEVNSYDRFIRLKEFDQGDHLLAVSWCHMEVGTNVFAGWIDTKNKLIHCRQAFGNDDYPDGLFVRYNKEKKCMSVYTSWDEPTERNIYLDNHDVLKNYHPPMTIERFHKQFLGWENKNTLQFIPLEFPNQSFTSPLAGYVQLNEEYSIDVNPENGKVQLKNKIVWSDLDYNFTKSFKHTNRRQFANQFQRYNKNYYDDVPSWYNHELEPQDRLLLIPSLTHQYNNHTWYFILQFIERSSSLSVFGANVCPATKKIRWSHVEERLYGCNFVVRYYQSNNQSNNPNNDYILIAADREPEQNSERHPQLSNSIPFPFNCSKGCINKITVSRDMTVLNESDLNMDE